MKMNRYQLEQMLAGIGQNLKSENEKLAGMYADSKTTIQARSEQKEVVKDLEERFNGIKAQIAELDRLAQKKLEEQSKTKGNLGGENPKAKIMAAKAEFVRATMKHKELSPEIKAALADDSTSGGDKFIPTTLTTELLHEPFVKDPLRNNSTFTAEKNLEIPKITFTLDDDKFVGDTETAKELKATGDLVTFGRHKTKVFVPISETILNGTDTNLVETVNAALESGLAAKEKKVAFTTTPGTGEESMSFYSAVNAIKAVNGTTKYKAIKAAIADLHEDYRENAKVCMTYADYLDIIESLANGSSTLYSAPPESILGKPAIFCDSATDPIVGDFSYSHFNYDPDTIYDQDKDVKTGINLFVLTAWFDHKIKLASAFRIAKVTP